MTNCKKCANATKCDSTAKAFYTVNDLNCMAYIEMAYNELEQHLMDIREDEKNNMIAEYEETLSVGIKMLKQTELKRSKLLHQYKFNSEHEAESTLREEIEEVEEALYGKYDKNGIKIKKRCN